MVIINNKDSGIVVRSYSDGSDIKIGSRNTIVGNEVLFFVGRRTHELHYVGDIVGYKDYSFKYVDGVVSPV